MKIHSSCEIEYFVETHLCKLCVILRSRMMIQRQNKVLTRSGHGASMQHMAVPTVRVAYGYMLVLEFGSKNRRHLI